VILDEVIICVNPKLHKQTEALEWLRVGIGDLEALEVLHRLPLEESHKYKSRSLRRQLKGFKLRQGGERNMELQGNENSA